MSESAVPQAKLADSKAAESAQSPSPEVRLQALVGQAAQPVLDDLLQLLLAELSETQDPTEHAELAVRMAMLLWDGQSKPDAALAILGAVHHPVASALRLQAALEGRSQKSSLSDYIDWVIRHGSSDEKTELGEILLWRGQLDTAQNLLAEGSAPRIYSLLLSSQELIGRAADTLSSSSDGNDLLWAASLRWQSSQGSADRTAAMVAVEHLAQQAEKSISAGGLAFRLLKLRASEQHLACLPSYGPGQWQLLSERFAQLGGDDALRGSSPSVELLVTALELATASMNAQVMATEAADLLVSVNQVTSIHPTLAGQVSQHWIERRAAQQLERVGRYHEAAQFWQTQANRLLETLPAPATESDTDQWTRALALAHLYRAAECWVQAVPQHGDEARTQAIGLATRLLGFGVADEVLALRMTTLLLQGSDRRAVCDWLLSCAQACPQANPERASLVIHAIRAAEALQAADRESQLSLQLVTDRATLHTLARQYRRRGELPKLLPIYRALSVVMNPADAEAVSLAASYSAVSVTLAACLLPDQLSEPVLGETDLAKLLIQLLAVAEPFEESAAGLLVSLARVLSCQRRDSGPELVDSLVTLLNRAQSPRNKLRILKQLGHHATEAGDLQRAEVSYQEVLERDPSDVVAMHALARLLQQRGDTHQAIELLRTAVEAALTLGGEASSPQPSTMAMLSPHKLGLGTTNAPVGAQAAALLACELGALFEQKAQSGDARALGEALTAYEGALRRDPRCRPAARALVSLYRAANRPTEQLTAMRRLQPLLRDDNQRLALLLELGQLAEAQAKHQGGDAAAPLIEQAIDAYSEALTLDPAHELALGSLVALCQLDGRWGLIAETLERAPKTTLFLRTLVEAYQQLGQPEGLARALDDLLPLLTDQGEILATLQQLAEMYQRLERPSDEIRVWERIYELSPELIFGDSNILLQLEHRYGASGRHAEQASLLQRALSRVDRPVSKLSPSDADHKRQLLLRLGQVQHEFLQASTEATRTFEKVLSEWPEDRTALTALVSLHAQGDPVELKRTLTTLLKLVQEPSERSRYLFQLGELLDKLGEADNAYRLYGEAFSLDAANRAAFTAYERACYRRQQWTEALKIYETALRLIETQKTRSYRPADLHLRRGQVQLQYLQQVDEALTSYLKALESDAENDATQATLERIFAGRNQWKELLSAYERRAQLVRDDSKRVEILRRAARVATAKLRDVNEAVRFYEKLHAVDPTDTESLDALEHHYESARDFEKLVALLSTRVTLASDEQQIITLHMRIGLLCEEGLRDHDRAISAYRHVVEAQPTHREALDAMARLLEANERWTELVEVTRRQIRLVTDRQHKALLYFKCGSVTEAKFAKEDEAIRYYEAAVRTSAACLPALHSLRDIYVRREDYAHVTQTLELESKLWTEPKEQAGILAHIGQIYLDKLHQAERAIEYYERALTVDKDCLPAHRALFHVYYQRGDFYRTYQTGQVLLLRAAREGEPAERSSFHAKRAHAASKVGELRIACESVVLALEIWPENLAALALLVSLCLSPDTGYDFAPTCRELEKQYRRRNLPEPLALLLCAQAALSERAGDSDTAETLLGEALRQKPDDSQVVELVAAAYTRLMRWDAAVTLLQSFIERLRQSSSSSLWPQIARCELLLAGLYSEVLLQPESAVRLLRQCLESASRSDSATPELIVQRARFALAQELFRIGRFLEARTEIDELLQAVQPEGEPRVSQAVLCRFSDYQGRILESLGDMTGAQQAYLKAIDLDPTYAPPVLQLSRWGVLTGNRDQAEALLRDAIERSGERTLGSAFDERASEIFLRRGLARLLTASDPQAAVTEYKRLIDLSADDHILLPLCFDLTSPAGPSLLWDGKDDRISLADVLVHNVGDTTQAEETLQVVLGQDLRCAAAYPLLAEVYDRRSESLRARRVRTVSALLGYSPPEKRPQRSGGYRSALNDDLRQRLLLPSALRGSLTVDLLHAMGPGLLRLFPPMWPWPVEATPASKVPDAGFQSAASEVLRLFAVEAEVMVADQVPSGALALELPTGRKVALIDQSVLAMGDSERRFLLGRTLDALRGGYATVLRLSPSELLQTSRLLSMLLLPTAEQPPESREFMQLLPRRSQQVFERAAQSRPTQTVAEVVASFASCADRAGLLAADDITTAVQVLVKMQGDEATALGLGEPAAGTSLVLGQAAHGAELVRYFLSDTFHELAQTLREPSRL
ncbi:MAG: tetratricopeptide repeat protein [Myxococcales bacterium]|nr:tetratricopeptide repeat protein [Myxococcales bacterium]